ncbi:metal-dependent hydrolase, partial [Acinetobacter baumannii]
TFPEGERFFVDSVRHYQKDVSPVLARQVSGFIGQDAHHGREHDAFNAFMQRKGLPMDRIDAFVRDGMKFMRRRLSPERQLAMTC